MTPSNTIHASFDTTDREAARIHDVYMSHLYKHLARDGQFTPLRGKHPTIKKVQLLGVDVVFTSKKTQESITVDEKADSHNPENICFEIASNTSVIPWVDGWGKEGKAQYLFYAFTNLESSHHVVDVFTIPFLKLQQFLWSFDGHRPRYEGYKPYRVPDTGNHSFSRLVPIKDIRRQMSIPRFLVSRYGEVKAISLDASPLDYLSDGHICISSEQNNITPIHVNLRVS